MKGKRKEESSERASELMKRMNGMNESVEINSIMSKSKT